MESFVYSALNTATRDHHEDKVQTLGPLAWALGTVVNRANSERQDKDCELDR